MKPTRSSPRSALPLPISLFLSSISHLAKNLLVSSSQPKLCGEIYRGDEVEDMANLQRQPSHFQQSLYGALQTLFALALFAIFIITWLVQGGSIALPQWAKAWNNATPEERTTYTAALVPAVCIVALIFFFAGFFVMRRERMANVNGMV
ncbi:hypothetical protein F4818DRAFT_398664 [Hypoxylon cercidicola]|nr:hypothetical protein F4818DRAFT_398664 [Hypoxylon cercidicola]